MQNKEEIIIEKNITAQMVLEKTEELNKEYQRKYPLDLGSPSAITGLR